MLTAGYIDGQLIYILEFSFNEPSFTTRLEEQLKRRFPNGDVTGQYLRSASFTFNHYKDADSLNPIFILPSQERYELKAYMSGVFFDFLEMLSQ